MWSAELIKMKMYELEKINVIYYSYRNTLNATVTSLSDAF